EAETCIARGRFDDRAAGLQSSVALRRFDHRKRDAVFDRSARIVVFELEEKLTKTGIEPCDLDERGVADERKDRRRFLRGGRMRELRHVATTRLCCRRKTAAERRSAFRRSSSHSEGRRPCRPRSSESSSQANRGN